MTNKYLNEHEVAELTGRAVPTLRNDRSARRGFPFIKIGRSVRYALDDIITFMEANRIKTVPA